MLPAPARNVYVTPVAIGAPESITYTGGQLRNMFSVTDRPAVAVAVNVLLLPSTGAANETPIFESGVVTCTKRMFAACPCADASLMYGPSRLTANKTFERGKE